ncbi:endonuclease MutS2 [Virgibacillus soli]|uniref:endonuclease MutS2 n=1 Tax=Paracerasibacillus soli TaxID=480284 RepID=UPI0035E58C96
MNDRILRVMEFDKVIEQLKKQAETSLGKERAAKLKPAIDMIEVEARQNETDEAMGILRLNKSVPLGGIFDIRASIKRSIIGGLLNIQESLDIASTIYGGRRVKDFLLGFDFDIPLLNSLAERIVPLKNVEQFIKNCIDDHGQVMDSATPTLRGIRATIRTYENRIRTKLDDYIRTKSNMLSDAIITIRNDRYVIPVKHEYRGSIGGIVHDQSASGQTLFMEPRPIVDMNNQLQEAFLKEKQEIERILRKITELIAENELELHENVTVLEEIDFIFARGKLAQKMKAAKPKMNNNGYIKMQQARHPLIPFDEVVANDIEIGKDYQAIVITGPNTGGKTVTLKMIGLCTLMAQSGLQVPALDGCELAVFKEVFADIGDEQSIEQNLSTFSSHMTNIVQILEKVDDQTLVLFDELGAGTDPQEGAALAIAILDEVISRHARVIATTHYPELKAYSYNREQVINASMEFDVQSLQPTYRLLLGIPGRSNAFEISRRLGLGKHIIDVAKSHVGVDSKNVENMIAALEKSQIQAGKDYEEAHQILLESEQLRDQLHREYDLFISKREELYKKAELKAEKAVQKAKEDAASIVENLRNMEKQAILKEHEWIDAKKGLEEALPQIASKKGATNDKKPDLKELKPGDDIILLTVNQQGTVVEKINDKEYLIQVGVMRVKTKRKDLQIVKKQKQQYENPLATVKGTSYHVKPELDLRGERYEDALVQLEKYIDDALLAGYQSVNIIHGKGTGALRKGVQDFAKKHPHIGAQRFGNMNEGGSGVTVLELK